MTIRQDVDVLIIGGGASGLAASMLLSSYGITTYLASRHPKTSNLPKAHIISIKTMEILRELGIEDAIRAISTPPAHMRYAGIYAGFAGDGPDYGREITRIGAWGRGGQDVEWLAASHVSGTNLMQSQLEPLMKARAEELAPDSVCFNHSLVSFEEQSHGIVATIEDRATGETYEISAKYLLACDGGRVIGPKLGIEMEGHLAVATSVSLHFSADLSDWARDPEVLTYTILNPDTGIPCVLVPMGPDPWGPKSPEWLVHLVSFAGDHKLFDDEVAIATMCQTLGLPDLNPTVHVINRWPLDSVVASRFRIGRTLILGDGAHRMPPAGGNGLNMAIQDAYNLCWKIAAVLKGQAHATLLDTYETERRPVAQEVVATAFKGWQSNKSLIGAIGFSPQNSPEQNWTNIRNIWAKGDDGDTARRNVARTLPGLLPNYNSLNVAHGFSYPSGAFIPVDDAPYSPLDPLGRYEPSSRPGHSMPHAWVENLHGRTALGDLTGAGEFVLIAGEEGADWCRAADTVANELGIALRAFAVGGTEGDWLDIRGTWEQVRGHGPRGALLVRPDRFVAWRSEAEEADAESRLRSVFNEILRQ